MLPDTRYCKAIFEDKSELDIYDGDALAAAKSEAKQRDTQLAYILRGKDQYTFPDEEFLPMQYFDADGNEQPEKLLAILLERGLSSRNIVVAATSAMVAKQILNEVKKGS